jgi:hypothetical protein
MVDDAINIAPLLSQISGAISGLNHPSKSQSKNLSDQISFPFAAEEQAPSMAK